MEKLPARTILLLIVIISLSTAGASGFLMAKEEWELGLFFAGLLIIHLWIFFSESKFSVNEERVTREELINAMWEYNITKSWQREEFKEAGDLKCAEEQVDTLLEIIQMQKEHPVHPIVSIKKEKDHV